jgi:plastocyanin
MNPFRIAMLIAAAALTVPVTTHAAGTFEVAQKNKAFSQKKLKVKVGDTVNFRNDDPFFHNVFSLSDPKTFDLGSYPQGQAKAVTFDKPGTVEIECSIHPEMTMVIEVEK